MKNGIEDESKYNKGVMDDVASVLGGYSPPY